MPCRIQDPDRKGKVESGVGHAKRTPLKGMRFESLEEAQAYLDLGRTLGRYTHPWHHQTPGCRHVRGRKTAPASTASGTFPLLPIRRTCSASGWLCGSRSRLLQFATGMDRTSGEGAMG